MDTLCRTCGHWTQTDTTCPCGTTNHRRGASSLERRARDGRNRRAWLRTRRLVLERDGHRCVDCGEGPRENDPLTVDKLGGGYHHGNPDAYKTRHRSCHGAIHAQGGVSL